MPGKSHSIESNRAAEKDRSTTPAKQRKPVVLLAEDDTEIRQTVTLVLQWAGCEVVTAADGREAVQLFCAQPDRIDHLILDIAMPRLNGLEACREIRRQRPEVPVVFCTGYSQELAVDPHKLPAGAKLLRKPFAIRELLGALQLEAAG